MTKIHFLKLSPLAMIFTLVASCVSNSTFNKLKGEQDKTQQELSATKGQKTELEQKLGKTTAERVELQQALEEMKLRKKETEKRIQEYQSLTRKFQRLVDSGKLSVKTIKGRMVVALQTDILFPSGSAKLSPEGITAIKEVTPLLVSIKDRSFQIEGHTDNVPIKSALFASNWELAAARASNVVKSMIEFGMPANRISAASFSETMPIAENDSPENKAKNRRIEIVVVPDLSGLPGYEELNKLGAEN